MNPQIWISPEAKEWRQWDRLLSEEAASGTGPYRYPAEATDDNEEEVWTSAK